MYPVGHLIVDGAHAYSDLSFGPGSSLEFRATFTSANFQNIGFSGDSDFNAPWNRRLARAAALMVFTHVWIAVKTSSCPLQRSAPPMCIALIGHRVVSHSTWIEHAGHNHCAHGWGQHGCEYCRDIANIGGGTLSVDWLRVKPYTILSCTLASRPPGCWAACGLAQYHFHRLRAGRNDGWF